MSAASEVAAGAGPLLRTTRDGPVVRLTLNRAAKYNVLSAEMIAALKQALEQLAREADVRVVVIAAEGRAFCAGHDLGEMGPAASLDELRALFAACSELMLTIQRLPQPVIARVQGVATAAGCQLVAMCDLAVASSDARFAVSGINLGLFCATPSVALSRNVAQKPALEMLLTGDFIDAPTALRARPGQPRRRRRRARRRGRQARARDRRQVAGGDRGRQAALLPAAGTGDRGGLRGRGRDDGLQRRHGRRPAGNREVHAPRALRLSTAALPAARRPARAPRWRRRGASAGRRSVTAAPGGCRRAETPSRRPGDRTR